VAPRLSHSNYGDSEIRNVSSLKRVDSHIILDAAAVSARYSAFVMYRATAFCFFKLQEMGLDPRKLIYVEVDVRSSILPAQLASK
jgi:hypothetical protein